MFELMNRNPTPRELRRFGISTWLVLLFIGLVFWWRGSASHGLNIDLHWSGTTSQKIALIVAGFGLLVLLLSFVSLRTTRWVYWVSGGVGSIVGECVTRIILMVVYFVVVTPIGLCLRLLRKKPLDLEWEDDRSTYWSDFQGDPEKSSYERQF